MHYYSLHRNSMTFSLSAVFLFAWATGLFFLLIYKWWGFAVLLCYIRNIPSVLICSAVSQQFEPWVHCPKLMSFPLSRGRSAGDAFCWYSEHLTISAKIHCLIFPCHKEWLVLWMFIHVILVWNCISSKTCRYDDPVRQNRTILNDTYVCSFKIVPKWFEVKKCHSS